MRKLLLATTVVLAVSGPAGAGDYSPATAPNTPKENVMLTVALALAAESECPLVQVNKRKMAEALVAVGVEMPRDEEFFTERREWAKAAVELSRLSENK